MMLAAGGEVRRQEVDLSAPPLIALRELAIFLDLDGTLTELRQTPGEVGPNAARAELLARVSAKGNGRLAVVSGRGLADLDRILGGQVVALGAVHGLVRRTASGRLIETPCEAGITSAALAFSAFAAKQSGVLVEDKKVAVALHYRCAPVAASACHDLAERVARDNGLEIQNGDMVVEVRAHGPDKGGAVAAFMAESPFTGAVPVFVGDDLTDEDGFRAAKALGGFGVIVGARRPTLAEHALVDVQAAARWLAALTEVD